ncbi:hypothetical protein Xbed_01053 [Xenorhabdus beddingii]|uniref:Major facilitator superfamily (MFS) profile domain-containing protein n=1 Tax=Xenorhabdus beddingii TaxID=40578 RepID=A0A1Y2SSN0_9GAMM|nr:MFS transporter [Xenorhabdus beddingii]OTA20803.1 hypothetical protein Xbed_01053 [Xenorhabdus beddingii]
MAIFYTIRQGFIKDVFEEGELYRINAILEIESQSSTLLAALLVIFFADSLSHSGIFMLLAGMAFISLIMLMVIYGCGAILVGFIMGWLSNRYPQRRLIFIFTATFAMTLGIMALYPTLEVILAGSFFLGFCHSASRVSSQNLILSEVDSAMIDRAFSYGQFFTLCGRIIATGLVPLIFTNDYRQAWNYVFAISIIAPTVLLFRRYVDKQLTVFNEK